MFSTSDSLLDAFWRPTWMQNQPKMLSEIKQSSEFRIEQIMKNGPNQGVQGAFHSQKSSWDPLGTPDGARAPPEGPLDDS